MAPVARGKLPPIGKLTLVGHHAALKAIMDGEDAVVRRALGKPVHHGLEVGTMAVGGQARLVRTGAMLTALARNDADRREPDPDAVDVQAAGARRLLEITADAGKGDGPLGIGHGHMIERFLQPFGAVVHGMVVGEREQVEAGLRQRFQPEGMTPEIVRGLLALAVAGEIVPVGDHRLEIEEGKIAVDVRCDGANRLAEAHELLALAHASRIDGGTIGVEARVADKNDAKAIRGTSCWRLRLIGLIGLIGLIADRRREFGAGAGRGPRRAMERARRRHEHDKHRR